MSPWLDDDLVDRLINQHLSLRPSMLPKDIYKLLYQGVCGPEHLISDTSSFEAYLFQEYQAVFSDHKISVWESIHPAADLGRINLQPFKAIRGSIEQLTIACFETAKINWGGKDLLISVWDRLKLRIEGGNIYKVDNQAVQALTKLLVENSFPPVHHTEQYQKAYQPAYRLVARQLLPILNLDGKGLTAL